MDEAIARLKAGDISGLETLVERYQIEAVQAAVLITGDRELAEDIVQSAFLRIFEKIQGFDETYPFRPWFMRIVVNDAIKAAVRRWRQISLSDEDDEKCTAVVESLLACSLEPEDIVEQREVAAALRQAIARLAPSQRASIVLHYFLNLSTAETAEKLGCSPGTLRWHLFTARARLQNLLSVYKESQEKSDDKRQSATLDVE